MNEVILTTFQLAATTTVILLLGATPLAWWLSQTQVRLKPLFEAIIALPLILPPTVIGFYLLLAFAPSAPIGNLWQTLTGEQLAFSFSALVIGSCIYSLPFVVQPLKNAFEQFPVATVETAATLGATQLDRFFSVVLPATRTSFVSASVLGFAHTVGEFGVILMIGGNIPGETRVLSIALYDAVETLRYDQAHQLALGLAIFSTVVLTVLYRLTRKHGRNTWF